MTSLPLLLVGFLGYIPPLNETSSSGRDIGKELRAPHPLDWHEHIMNSNMPDS